ncbi:MAG: hypothetical protein IJ759_02260 [Bacteroidales bacterium]|nr:hypothetical protein [Bacteroidales bacterium]
MKKIIIIACLLFAYSLTTQARARIIYSNGQKVSKVLDLPTDENFEIIASDGNVYHANLGILYKQFSLFWIPLFNYGENQYVLYTDTKIGEYDFTYSELEPSEIKILQEEYGYNIPTTPQLPSWDRIGGKLLALAIVCVLIIYGLKKGKDESEIATE